MEKKTYRVALIEDEQGVAKLIESGLKNSPSFDFQVEKFGDLTGAAKRIPQGKIDLILLDLGLPDSSGYLTFDAVKKIAGKIPIVVLTGLDDESVGLKAVENGAQDFLVKGHMDITALPRTLGFAIQRAAQ